MLLQRILDHILRELLWWLAAHLPPPRPIPPGARLIQQENDMTLVYEMILPPPTAPDVVSAEVTAVFSTPDGVVTSTTYANAKTGDRFSAHPGDSVSLSCVFIDGAGNKSEASDPYVFTASDTLPPGKPGSMGATLVAEGEDVPPPPDGGDVPPPPDA